nr:MULTISPECIES: XRE family transcriptional regulator [unclassified Leucobacter]
MRHLLRMTQGELAASVEMNASYLSKIENDQRVLTKDIVTKLALRHRIPTSFFLTADPIDNFAAPTFRKKASSTVKESRYVEVLQKLAMRLFHIASLDTDYTKWTSPVADNVTDPEEAAKQAREFFGLGPTDAVRNVTRLLERNGAGVITNLSPATIEEVSLNHHGITRPSAQDDRPLVALFDSGRGDVNRLTTAHELGHLIFDAQGERIETRAQEARAFRFGGAFLLPQEVAREWISHDLPLSGYLAIKAQYGISVSAAIRRGKDLGLIDHDRYRSLMIQHSTRGWRHNEPGNVEPETALLVPQALRHAWPTNTVPSAATATGIPARLISEWSGLPESSTPSPQRDENPGVISLADARAKRAA